MLDLTHNPVDAENQRKAMHQLSYGHDED